MSHVRLMCGALDVSFPGRRQGYEQPTGDARKACPRCREVKPVSEFHRKYADDPSSTQTYCRRCHGDMKREKGVVGPPLTIS